MEAEAADLGLLLSEGQEPNLFAPEAALALFLGGKKFKQFMISSTEIYKWWCQTKDLLNQDM